MIWLSTKASHQASIAPRTRAWLRSSFLDRFFLVLSAPSAWLCWGVAILLLIGLGSEGVPFLAVSSVPFLFWVVDAILDRHVTAGEIDRLLRDGAVLATRAEYVGGHPRLPHGRFAYLALTGARQNPLLRLIFPGPTPPPSSPQPDSHANTRRDDTFDMPLLDLQRTAEKRETVDSLASAFLASLTEKPGKRTSEDRVTLNVDYQGSGGRKHRVELTSFFNGPDEIRNWRNYLVCAQAEADTGETPFGPWASLKDEPATEVISSDGTGNGSKVQSTSRAFERR